MGLIDLSYVTDSLLDLLDLAAEHSDAFNLSVEALPPEKMDQNGLSLHLYHVVEDEAAKNAPPPDPTLPIKHAPMGLRLYYRLSAHQQGADSKDYEALHDSFGHALKIFHDYPELTPETTIGGEPVLGEASVGNLRIAMLPVTNDDAIEYWSASDSEMRLAAYYQVSTVFLEAEKPPSKPVPTRARRVHASAGLALTLTESFSVHLVENPEGDDGDEIEIEVTPGRPTLGSTVGLRGAGWSGEAFEVRLHHNRYDGPLSLPTESVLFDNGSELEFSLADSVDGEGVLPGLYTVSVRTTGTPANESNRVPLVIAPDLSDSDPVELGKTLQLGPGPFEGDESLDVEVIAGDRYLEEVEETPNEGQFFVESPDRLEMELPEDLSTPVAVRVVVDGAESLPLVGGDSS